jgi:hypothetical protein
MIIKSNNYKNLIKLFFYFNFLKIKIILIILIILITHTYILYIIELNSTKINYN